MAATQQTPLDSFPTYLDTHLQRRGWGIPDLAKATGISPGVIYRWRSGETEPGIPNGRKAARALGVPLLELLIVAGALTPDETGAAITSPTEPTVSAASNERLLSELRSRLESNEHSQIDSSV